MQFSRGRRRRSFYYKKRRTNFIPFLTLVVFLGCVIWAGKFMITSLFSSEQTEASSTIIHILEGKAEFSLATNEATDSTLSNTWTTAFSEQKFYAGDSLRTNSNARISLEILGGNTIFLGPNTEIKLEELEQKSSGKKLVHINLKKALKSTGIHEVDSKLGHGIHAALKVEVVGI
jgi:ribosomal protein L9